MHRILDRLDPLLREFVALTTLPAALALLSRCFEYAVVTAKHGHPVDLLPLLPSIALSDGVYILSLSAVLLLIYLPAAVLIPAAARWIHYGAGAIFIAAQFGLIKYYSITLIPLGVDLFGYSWSDIVFTVSSSSNTGILTFLLPAAAFAGVIWVHHRWIRSITISRRTGRIVASASFITLFASPLLIPDPRAFSSDIEYAAAVNKSLHFARAAVEYAAAPPVATLETESEYPLMRRFPYQNVLGPFLHPTSTPPNIVVIIAEGLGREFVGPGARYGGFVPFLDSLIPQSLYWENFLSTSGRTFGVLPSLLGSLPYGSKGFNELEYRMPRHLSLIRILNRNNYRVNFLYGGNKNFDKKDVFLEHEQVSLILDETKFGPDYEKAASDNGGFSWGYPDGEVFRKAIETLAGQRPGPRLDIYLTMSTHEPFLPPNREQYLRRVDAMALRAGIPADIRQDMVTYRDQFSSFLYFNDAVRYLLTEYAKRPDYANTIFFITGDHRIIPIPTESKIERFHVPLIVFSPLVRQPQMFSSVSSHLDVTPTILALLKERYRMRVPDDAHWLGDGIDTAREFRNIHAMPFMRVKEEIADYLDGPYFLSDDRLYRLLPGLGIEETEDPVQSDSLRRKLEHFRQVNAFVIDRNRLMPRSADQDEEELSAQDIAAFRRIDSLGLDPDKLFLFARQKAFDKQTEEARIICRRLLASSPNFHDARVLLGRTYAWNKEYAEAKRIFREVLTRDETYQDAYTALADVQLWSDSASASLDAAQNGLHLYPASEDLHVRAVKAFVTLRRRHEADSTLKRLTAINPNHPDLPILTRRVAGM